jgi:asparagine synthase (glutamine-hydrolysing)
MPGIVGLITKMPRDIAEAELLRMVESIRHESNYITGTWIDESLGVYVGWVARKGSFADGMPLRNERENVVLVFSGEEFPHQEP